MKAYNIKNLESGLQEVAQQIKGHEIITCAAMEQIDPTTVRNYLKGKVTTPAIGKAILDRCRSIILERQNTIAA